MTLGDYDEGWTFVWEYFWRGENWLVGLWVAAVVMAAGLALGKRKRHLLWWVGAAVVIYLGLAWLCIGMKKFVIYGRIARCLVPFFALATGGCLAAVGRWGRWGQRRQIILLTAIGVQAAVNFAPVLTQYFPLEFQQLALRRIAVLPAGSRGAPRILNAYFFHQAQFVTLPEKYRLVLRRPHPLQFRPYQYEGYRRDQRLLFDTHDIAMMLVLIEGDANRLTVPPNPALGGYLGPVGLEVLLPRQPGLLGEPLVTTGNATRGDLLYVNCFPAEGTIQVGLDHWSYGGPVTAKIHLDYGKPHRFEILLGSLMPPDSSGTYRRFPHWRPLHRRLYVRLDGRILLNQDQDFYPADAMTATLASNLIGGSTANPDFGGKVLRMEALDPAVVPAQ